MEALVFLLCVAVIVLGIATFCLYQGFKNFKSLVNDLIDKREKPTKR